MSEETLVINQMDEKLIVNIGGDTTYPQIGSSRFRTCPIAAVCSKTIRRVPSSWRDDTRNSHTMERRHRVDGTRRGNESCCPRQDKVALSQECRRLEYLKKEERRLLVVVQLLKLFQMWSEQLLVLIDDKCTSISSGAFRPQTKLLSTFAQLIHALSHFHTRVMSQQSALGVCVNVCYRRH